MRAFPSAVVTGMLIFSLDQAYRT